jgi:hypothetical protein
MLEPLPPTLTAPLYRPLHTALLGLLRGLGAADWARPTVAGAWRVRDIAAHLLDVDLRRLSTTRDAHLTPPDRPLNGYEDVVRFLNHLNATWLHAMERLSPRLLVDLLAVTGPAVADLVDGLAPDGEATFPVAWAGEARSTNWMDIGRDYTERWHHQQQVRDAVGASGLLERRWLHPVLELSVRAFPRTCAALDAGPGTALGFEVTGEAGGQWTVRQDAEGWRVWRGAATSPEATVSLDPGDAWRLFFNALPVDQAWACARVTGRRDLAGTLLGTRAVMV